MTTIGPAEFNLFAGTLIAVRCPSELDDVMRAAGGEWEPATRQWLIEQRRIGPVVRCLRLRTDPLFRQAGLDLDDDDECSFLLPLLRARKAT